MFSTIAVGWSPFSLIPTEQFKKHWDSLTLMRKKLNLANKKLHDGRFLGLFLLQLLNPSSPKSDQSQISPCNITAL